MTTLLFKIFLLFLMYIIIYHERNSIFNFLTKVLKFLENEYGKNIRNKILFYLFILIYVLVIYELLQASNQISILSHNITARNLCIYFGLLILTFGLIGISIIYSEFVLNQEVITSKNGNTVDALALYKILIRNKCMIGNFVSFKIFLQDLNKSEKFQPIIWQMSNPSIKDGNSVSYTILLIIYSHLIAETPTNFYLADLRKVINSFFKTPKGNPLNITPDNITKFRAKAEKLNFEGLEKEVYQFVTMK